MQWEMAREDEKNTGKYLNDIQGCRAVLSGSGLITVLKNMTATAKLTIHMAEITGIIQTVGHFVVMD